MGARARRAQQHKSATSYKRAKTPRERWRRGKGVGNSRSTLTMVGNKHDNRLIREIHCVQGTKHLPNLANAMASAAERASAQPESSRLRYRGGGAAGVTTEDMLYLLVHKRHRSVIRLPQQLRDLRWHRRALWLPRVIAAVRKDHGKVVDQRDIRHPGSSQAVCCSLQLLRIPLIKEPARPKRRKRQKGAG